jgi:hypothetical protein
MYNLRSCNVLTLENLLHNFRAFVSVIHYTSRRGQLTLIVMPYSVKRSEKVRRGFCCEHALKLTLNKSAYWVRPDVERAGHFVSRVTEFPQTPVADRSVGKGLKMPCLISLGNQLQRGENSSKPRLKDYGKIYMNLTGGLTSAPISITAWLHAVVYLAVGGGGVMGLIRNIFIARK